MINTWLQREEKGEVIHRAGGCETEIHCACGEER